MNKKLLNQIKNEWRSNTWMVIELLFVSVLMWYVVDYIYTAAVSYCQPLGFDATHCYNLSLSRLDGQNIQFDPNDTVFYDDLNEMVSRVRRLPGVEVACLSDYAAVPYSQSCMMSSMAIDTMKVDDGLYFKCIQPDFLRVFRCQGENGETPEQLEEMFKRNPEGFMASVDAFEKNAKSYVGRDFILNGDSTKRYRLIALYKSVRHDDFSTKKESHSVMYLMTKKNYNEGCTICVRVKPDADINFKDVLWKFAEKNLQIKNLYVSSIQTYSGQIRDDQIREKKNELRNYFFVAAFLLLNIFFGLLGTFWFRTQERRGETALFKAMGATNRNVFTRQMTEGLLLLTIATIPAIIIDFNIAYAGLNMTLDSATLTTGRFINVVVITYLLIALMIFFGNLMPSLKSMKVQPAEALHEE
jgi:putative ABC transport system permease protein